MKIREAKRLTIEEDENLTAIRPQKLFAITVITYSLLTILILAACFFVKYPISYPVLLIEAKVVDQDHLKISYYVTGNAKLDKSDPVILSNKTGKKYTTSISSSFQEKDKLRITVLIKSNQDISVITTNKLIELTKHERLFTVLIRKLN